MNSTVIDYEHYKPKLGTLIYYDQLKHQEQTIGIVILNESYIKVYWFRNDVKDWCMSYSLDNFHSGFVEKGYCYEN